MDMMGEFFAMHRNGKNKEKKDVESTAGGKERLDLDETLFHSRVGISFSLRDVFKAGILCAEFGAQKNTTASPRNQRKKKSTSD